SDHQEQPVERLGGHVGVQVEGDFSFDTMMGRMSSLPFVGKVAFDLNAYVTAKALDGLFLMIGREEEKIRRDPVARTTDILKTVFGGPGESGKKRTPWWKKAVSGGSSDSGT